jgi:hypothetical protein
VRNRMPPIDQAQVEKLKADGLGATEIAKRLNLAVPRSIACWPHQAEDIDAPEQREKNNSSYNQRIDE